MNKFPMFTIMSNNKGMKNKRPSVKAINTNPYKNGRLSCN